jgi:hypothetical protein
MCYFITVCIPESFDEYMKEVSSSGMSFWRCENAHIMKNLKNGFQGYVLTTAMCSCDLYSAPLSDVELNAETNKRIKKYKSKGWSKAKIQRAIADATSVSKTHTIGLRPDAREVIARVADTAKLIYLFVHMYSGDQMTEKVVVNQGATILSSELISGDFVLEPDILVSVKGII